METPEGKEVFLRGFLQPEPPFVEIQMTPLFLLNGTPVQSVLVRLAGLETDSHNSCSRFWFDPGAFRTAGEDGNVRNGPRQRC